VAVVGAGPAGLTVADELVRRGHEVVVYDEKPKAGGATRYGIPSFKLPKDTIDEKVDTLERAGVRFVFGTRIGDEVTVDQLLAEGADAVFLGTGAAVGAPLKAPGADLAGIHQATPFLSAVNLPAEDLAPGDEARPEVGRRVAVIGGGDTAMDCVRSALRMGAEEVTCVYRRTEAQMPGNLSEREFAREEGVQFMWLTAPTEFIGDDGGHVAAMRCQRMKLGEPDDSGRRRPEPIEGDEFTMDVDTVILALGYWPDPLMGETTEDLETHDWGLITADEMTGRTSRPEIFAAGDNVRGADLVVNAMLGARRAAESIDEYLRGLDG
jgi:glutamate synthase (NADPH/NADH) small chain